MLRAVSYLILVLDCRPKVIVLIFLSDNHGINKPMTAHPFERANGLISKTGAKFYHHLKQMSLFDTLVRLRKSLLLSGKKPTYVF